jgi:hypothetical protein
MAADVCRNLHSGLAAGLLFAILLSQVPFQVTSPASELIAKERIARTVTTTAAGYGMGLSLEWWIRRLVFDQQ